MKTCAVEIAAAGRLIYTSARHFTPLQTYSSSGLLMLINKFAGLKARSIGFGVPAAEPALSHRSIRSLP